MALVYYLNWTTRTYAFGGLWHDRNLFANIVVFSRYPGRQKQMHFNLAITDFPGFFKSLLRKSGAKHRSETGVRRVLDLCLAPLLRKND